MKQVQVRRPGGRGALRLVEGPDPAPGPGEALVRVRAAGVNYADCMVRMGLYEAARGRYPLTPGFEFAGTVEEVGPGVSRVKPGGRVFGAVRFGGYASAIAADERLLWPVPEDWSDAEAACLPAVHLTAWHALHEVARVRAGETLLVHSGAGGVGCALLQLAGRAGCPAVAVVGAPHKTALCRELGAAAVVDKSAADLWAEAQRLRPGGFDVVLDANGAETLRAGWEHLAPGGRLLVYGFASMLPRGAARPNRLKLALDYLRTPRFSPFELTSKNRAVMGFNVVHLFDRLDLAERAMRDVLEGIGEGAIGKVPVRTFPAERAADAHAALESGTTVGKLALAFD